MIPSSVYNYEKMHKVFDFRRGMSHQETHPVAVVNGSLSSFNSNSSSSNF